MLTKSDVLRDMREQEAEKVKNRTPAEVRCAEAAKALEEAGKAFYDARVRQIKLERKIADNITGIRDGSGEVRKVTLSKELRDSPEAYRAQAEDEVREAEEKHREARADYERAARVVLLERQKAREPEKAEAKPKPERVPPVGKAKLDKVLA